MSAAKKKDWSSVQWQDIIIIVQKSAIDGPPWIEAQKISWHNNSIHFPLNGHRLIFGGYNNRSLGNGKIYLFIIVQDSARQRREEKLRRKYVFSWESRNNK